MRFRPFRWLLAVALIIATTASAEACHRRGGKSAKSGCSAAVVQTAPPTAVVVPKAEVAPLVSVSVSGCASGTCTAPAREKRGFFRR